MLNNKLLLISLTDKKTVLVQSWILEIWNLLLWMMERIQSRF